MDVNSTTNPNPKERKGEDPEQREPREEEVITQRTPTAPPPNPMKPAPATPDANPIDPRVGQPW